jgi:hypothetical protein
LVASAHWLLAHGIVDGVVQEPAPLQTEELVPDPLAQLAALHWTEPPGKAQEVPLLPSHILWQGAVPPQALRLPRGAPETLRQVPALLGSLQDWHWPPQAPPQQTPSVQ